MDSLTAFKTLVKECHSVRLFQKDKEIPKETLKSIISVALDAPSWCNSQPWNVYVASGKTLSEIRTEWIQKNKDGVKGYSDLEPGHRTDFSERSQQVMGTLFKQVGELLKDPTMKAFSDSQTILFNSPSIVYLTVPKKRIPYSILDLGGLMMNVMLSAKAHGVDSLVAYESIKYPDVIRKNCKVPDDEDIIIGIGLGYEDSNGLNTFRSTKLTIEEACHFYD